MGWSTSGEWEAGVRLAESLIERVKALKNVKRICDLGCGNGYIAGQLALLGYEVVGVDASESGIRTASLNHPQATFINAFIDETLR